METAATLPEQPLLPPNPPSLPANPRPTALCKPTLCGEVEEDADKDVAGRTASARSSGGGRIEASRAPLAELCFACSSGGSRGPLL